MSLESNLKQQYAKFFTKSDSQVFKLMAEYYFRKAAILKTKDIDIDEIYKKLVRNVQKRLFIGIGFELLLKAFFLRNDYCINTPQRGYKHPTNPPYLVKDIPKNNFDIDNTFTFSQLIDQLPKTALFPNLSLDGQDKVSKALKIAKVFRNKEGHVATLWHKYDSTNYSDIEDSLVILYRWAFSENLEVQISFEPNEKGKFILESA